MTATARRLSSGKLVPALLVVALTVAAAGCGGGGKPRSVPEHAVRLNADATGALTFHPTQARTAAGNVELVMSNPSPVAHGIAIEGGGVNRIGAVVGRGRASTLIVTLKQGHYAFYCPVPGHRQAGMSGTLTIR